MHDEGEETLTLRLTNPSGSRVADGEATGTIENRDPLPRALLARFGRTAAMHVVEHVEERLAAPREPGFRGRFAGRDLRRGMEREMALNLLSQLGGMAGVSPRGGGVAGSPGAGADGMGPGGTPGLAGGAAMWAAAPLGSTTGTMGPTGLGASGVGAVTGPIGAAAGPAEGTFNGRGLLQMGLGGGDLLTDSDFALNRRSRGGILSFWSRGARAQFAGREGTLGLGGDVSTTMFGADYARGPIVAGLSLSRSRGLGEYAGAASGQVLSSVTGLYPWLGYRVTDRITVWGVGGYGGGGLLLTPQGGSPLESGLSMKMAAAGTRGELVTAGASGFALAFKADALWVGTSIDGVDGPAGRLAATDAAVTRFRTGPQRASRTVGRGSQAATTGTPLGLRERGHEARARMTGRIPMRNTIVTTMALATVWAASVQAQVDHCAELLRLSRTTSRTVMDRSQLTRTVDNFCNEARAARTNSRSLDIDLRVLGIGAGGGSIASTNSTFMKYCGGESDERREELNYKQYLDGIDPGAYAAYDACTAAARNGVQFQLLPPTRDALQLIVSFPTDDPNAQADMSWDGIGPIACQWEGGVETSRRLTLEADQRTRLTCDRESYNVEPIGEPNYVNVIRDGGSAVINIPWLKYNEEGEPHQTLEEIRQQIDAEVARLRNEVSKLEARMGELEQEPSTIFGDWKPVVVGEIHRAESDGVLTAYSGGRGDIGRTWLETGESEDRLVARNRGGQYEGGAIPVKKGHYYRVRMRSGSRGTVTAYWIQVGR